MTAFKPLDPEHNCVSFFVNDHEVKVPREGYSTDDEAEIEALSAHPLLVVHGSAPTPPPPPEPADDPEPADEEE